jgi:OmpA-OmpF porin, OOP family
LQLPAGARQLTDRVNPLTTYDLPTGPFANDALPVRILEGRVEKRSWRVGVGAGTTLQVLAPLRTQLKEAGYDILLDCAARACGGFDFRFETEVIPAPDMYVAVRDYRFLSATKGDQALSLLVSRQSPDAYIQIIRVSPGSQEVAPIVTQAGAAVPTDQSFSDLLKQDGHAVLDGLEFKEGANTLQEEEAPGLQRLVDTLEADPDLRVILVGHTDNVGALEANIKLGKARAQAVRDLLVERYGIASDRVQAEGMGYLAPITTNDTAEGRDINRRVEVVTLSR